MQWKAVWTLNPVPENTSAFCSMSSKFDEVSCACALCKVIGIVEVDETLVVSSNNIAWKKLNEVA